MQERTLLFPEDLTVGSLDFGRDDEWRAGPPARGRVSVPRGASVRLVPHTPLRGLAGLAPDAVDVIDLPKKTPTDADLQRIAHLTGLRALRCSKAHALTDLGLAHLAGLRRLRDLDLYATAVGDAGLEHLAGMAHLSHLHLGRTRVQGPGLRRLAGLQRLEWLSLEDTDVDDGVVPCLAALGRLRTIAVFGTRLSTRGLAELGRALPAARIAMRDPGQRLAGERSRRALLGILARRICPSLPEGASPSQALARLLPPGTTLEWRAPGVAPRPLGLPFDDAPLLARCLAALPVGATLRFVTPEGRELWVPWLRRRRGGRRASDARPGGRRSADATSRRGLTFH
jgi:hypothetical protein